MNRQYRIPTKRSSASRWAAFVVLAVVVAFSLALLTGCDFHQAARPGTGAAYRVVVYVDSDTGCEYLSTGQVTALTPRLNREGKQICH